MCRSMARLLLGADSDWGPRNELSVNAVMLTSEQIDSHDILPLRALAPKTLSVRHKKSESPSQRLQSKTLSHRCTADEAQSDRRNAEGIFRWLLATEPHDRLENLHSTKEVPPHES